MFDGIQEVEINGKKRGFKFGPRAIALGEREDGCKAGELFKKMNQGDQLAILNIFYGAALDYAKVKKIEVDFDSSDVADWVYDIGLQKSLAILGDGLKSYFEKNLKAPATSQTGAGE